MIAHNFYRDKIVVGIVRDILSEIYITYMQLNGRVCTLN